MNEDGIGGWAPGGNLRLLRGTGEIARNAGTSTGESIILAAQDIVLAGTYNKRV